VALVAWLLLWLRGDGVEDADARRTFDFVGRVEVHWPLLARNLSICRQHTFVMHRDEVVFLLLSVGLGILVEGTGRIVRGIQGWVLVVTERSCLFVSVSRVKGENVSTTQHTVFVHALVSSLDASVARWLALVALVAVS
jgi:hypothetical protein